MTKEPTTTRGQAPSPDDRDRDIPQWEPPTSDQEFEFRSVQEAPSWVDKNWASFSMGPALAVPMGHLDGTGPYHTQYARVGDTVRFVAAKGAKEAHMEVIQGEPDPKEGGVTRKPPQQSACSLEDALRTGTMAPDDLGADAKAQVAARTPGLRRMIEDGHGAPEPQNIGDVVKVG
jgi:hypothetical protein